MNSLYPDVGIKALIVMAVYFVITSMVRILPFLAFIAMCASVPTQLLYAQRVAIAPIIQGGVNMPYAGFPSLSDAPACCSEFGTGVGASGSVGLEILTSAASAFSISLRGMVGGSRDILWTRDQIGWTMQRTSNGNKVYPAYSTYVLDLASSVADASMLINIRPQELSSWLITAGAGLTSPMTATYDQYEVFDADPTQILADSRRPQRDTSIGDVSSSTSPFARVIAGVRYERSLAASTKLIYDFTANVGLSPMLSSGGGSLTSYSLRATVGMMFDLYSRAAGPMPAPEPEPEPEPEPIAVQSPTPRPEPIPEPISEPIVDSKPDTTSAPAIERVRETTPIEQPVVAVPEPKPEPKPTVEVSTTYQLIPYVFFTPGSSTLWGDVYDAQCRENQTQEIEALIDTALTIDTYTEKHYQINRQLLNIIGYRMKIQYPNARLVVSGYDNGRSSDAVANIGDARARAIASYLKECWQVEAQRLIIASHRGVSPSACTYALRDQLDIRDAEEENSRCELVSPNEPLLLAPVVASVNIPRNQIASTDVACIVRICAAGQTPVSTSQLVRSAVKPDGASGVAYVVTGYTDRKGPTNINQRISEQRARRAAALLGTTNDKLTIDWIGEGARGMRAPYTNDNPLGRLLNRCAEVRRVSVNQQP